MEKNQLYFQVTLKALETLVKYQYNSHLMYPNIGIKLTNLWTFLLNSSLKLQENNERKKHPFCTDLCAFRCLKKASSFNISVRNYLFSKSHFALFAFFLYHQQLSIAHYQVICLCLQLFWVIQQCPVPLINETNLSFCLQNRLIWWMEQTGSWNLIP